MKHWSPEERAEYEGLLLEVVKREEGQADRVDYMEHLMADATQARRGWAVDLDRDCRRDGYARQIKNYLKRTRVVFARGVDMVEKPRVVGVTRKAEDGSRYAVQSLYETLTFDELRDKRRAYLAQRRSYDESVALCDRYLALADMAPGSSTPLDATRSLGIEIDVFLAGAS